MFSFNLHISKTAQYKGCDGDDFGNLEPHGCQSSPEPKLRSIQTDGIENVPLPKRLSATRGRPRKRPWPHVAGHLKGGRLKGAKASLCNPAFLKDSPFSVVLYWYCYLGGKSHRVSAA